jgi:hypothetical protein
MCGFDWHERRLIGKLHVYNKSVKERLEQRETRSVKSEIVGQVFLAVKYSYDPVFVAKEEIMLHGIIPRTTEIGIPYGRE